VQTRASRKRQTNLELGRAATGKNKTVKVSTESEIREDDTKQTGKTFTFNTDSHLFHLQLEQEMK